MRKIAVLLVLCGLFSLFCFIPACQINPPSSSASASSATKSGTVAINDVAIGTCPVNVWLDTTGPVTILPGTLYQFTNVSSGTHNLTVNTTATVSCSATPGPCMIANYGSTMTGYSCEFGLSSGAVTLTGSITDNGCNILSVECP